MEELVEEKKGALPEKGGTIRDDYLSSARPALKATARLHLIENPLDRNLGRRGLLCGGEGKIKKQKTSLGVPDEWKKECLKGKSQGTHGAKGKRCGLGGIKKLTPQGKSLDS